MYSFRRVKTVGEAIDQLLKLRKIVTPLRIKYSRLRYRGTVYMVDGAAYNCSQLISLANSVVHIQLLIGVGIG